MHLCLCSTGGALETKDAFCHLMLSLATVAGHICALEIVVVGGDFDGCTGASMDGYNEVHGGYGLDVRNVDREWV